MSRSDVLLVSGQALLPGVTQAPRKRLGMGGHHSRRMVRDEWLTPPHVIKALGLFDLDPCAPVTRPWDTAATHYTVNDNGLIQEWTGRVWLNPPYGNEIGKWMARLAGHGDGIALVFARTETIWFRDFVWPAATALFFFHGRLSFCNTDGAPAANSSGAPSVLIAYGPENAKCLQRCGLSGAFVRLRHE